MTGTIFFGGAARKENRFAGAQFVVLVCLLVGGRRRGGS